MKTDFFHGVPLFNRGKNRIELNDNGRLATEEPASVLKQTQDMLRRVRTFDKAQHTISIGSCITLPVPDLIRQLNAFYPSATISTEMKMPSELVSGLSGDTYQFQLFPAHSGLAPNSAVPTGMSSYSSELLV